MADEDTHRMIAVMKSYERKSKLPHYDMWGQFTESYNFKVEELNYITKECPKALQSGALALDAGCGVGVYLSMLTQKGYNAVGLDVSAGMLKKARILLEGENVSFVKGSVTHLPFRDHVFDLILCVDTLHHFTDRHFSEALYEFGKVVRPEGILISDTKNALNPILWVRYRLSNIRWTDKGGLTLIPRSLKQVEKKLKERGFQPVKTKSIGFLVGLVAPYIVVIATTHRRQWKVHVQMVT